MARETGPKNKIARRFAVDLGLKTNAAKLQRRLNIPPGQHGRKGTRKKSNFGVQLLEKQKTRYIYGILEKQFRRYMEKAQRNPAATGVEFLRLLELRLDNTLFRLGMAPTRAAARQLVSHGHVTVNNKKVDIPSYEVSVGDVVALSAKAIKIPAIASMLEQKTNVPKWLERKANVGKISSLPQREDVDAQIDENLIVEYYSR
jgi:small subunit ribosomal protein S4